MFIFNEMAKCLGRNLGTVAAFTLSVLAMSSPNAAWGKPGSASSQARQADLGLGVLAGPMPGVALNLRARLSPKWGVSASGGIGAPGYPFSIIAGIQGMREIWSRGRIRSYGLLASYYEGQRVLFEKPFAGESLEREFFVWAVGAGLGVEAQAGPVTFVFELPFAAVVALTPNTDLRFPGRVNYGLFPQLALCVYFRAFREWLHRPIQPWPQIARGASQR